MEADGYVKSYSLILFKQHMNGQDLVAMVLRGHLWVESCLNALLEVALAQPDAIDIDRATFAQKIRLCVATAAISADEGQLLAKINRMRNRLAHELAGEPTHSEVLALVQSTQGRIRDVFEATTEPWSRGLKTEDAERILARWFLAVVMHLAAQRNLMAWEATFKRELETANLEHVAHEVMSEQDGRTVPTLDSLYEKYGVGPPPDPRQVWSD